VTKFKKEYPAPEV